MWMPSSPSVAAKATRYASPARGTVWREGLETGDTNTPNGAQKRPEGGVRPYRSGTSLRRAKALALSVCFAAAPNATRSFPSSLKAGSW